jgi:hypothetical protein
MNIDLIHGMATAILDCISLLYDRAADFESIHVYFLKECQYIYFYEISL